MILESGRMAPHKDIMLLNANVGSGNTLIFVEGQDIHNIVTEHKWTQTESTISGPIAGTTEIIEISPISGGRRETTIHVIGAESRFTSDAIDLTYGATDQAPRVEHREGELVEGTPVTIGSTVSLLKPKI